MSTHQEIGNLLSKTQEEFNKKNWVDNLQSSMKLLKMTDTKQKNKICLQLIKNQGVWKCKCLANKESIYCNDCWGRIKDKHIAKSHYFEYIIDYICGTCDCGNTNNMEEEFICPKHKNISSEIKIEEEVKKNEFNNMHKELFSQMNKYIYDNIEINNTKNEKFQENIKTFVSYIANLSFNSGIYLNCISELLLKNYSINNKNFKHKCINISNYYAISRRDNFFNRLRASSHEALMIYNMDTEENNCTCPFLRHLMTVWPNGNHNNYNIILRFSQNYDLKISIGILYLFLYDELILNEKNDFSYLSKDFLFSDIRIILSKHNDLLNNLLQSPELIIKNYISPLIVTNNNNNLNDINIIKKYYSSLKKVVNNLKFDILSVLSEDVKNIFSKDAKFYLSLIDVLANFHNINPIKWKFNPTEEETKETYNSILLQTELSLLDIFTTMTTIIDFSKENLIKEIFIYFDKKISEKEYKNIPKEEFSYHITLFRGFSIFLNRYCFHYANINNSDVTEGFDFVKNLMPNFNKVIEILFSELSKLFRFIAACGENLFIHYGKNMNLYEKTYYYTYKFVYRDFSLMKYLIPRGSFSEFFAINDTKDPSSITEIIPLFKEKNINLDLGDTKKIIKYISKLLTIALNIIRDNGSLIWNLGSSLKALKSCNIIDKLLYEVINKDITNMKEIATTLIINKAIIEQNSASFSDLYNGIYYILRELIGEKEVENIVENMFISTKTNDQKNNYSIKDDHLSKIDTNYILSPVSKAKAEKYLLDFKNNKITIFNRNFYSVNKFEEKLSQKIYEKIFSINSDNSISSMFDWIKKLIINEEYIILRPFFLNTLLNYFDIFLELDYKEFKDFRKKLENKIYEFIDTISNNNLEEPYKSYCDLIIKKVKRENIIEENKNGNETELNNKIKSKRKNLIEKYNINNEQFFNNIIKKMNEDKKLDENQILEMIIEPDCDKICIFCKKYIKENELGNCYGKIGYFLLDKFNHNAKIRILKKLYDKYIQNNKSILEFKNIYDPKKENEEKSLRILNCGHFIHFSCFFSNYMKEENVAIYNYICPVCKKYGNTFVPKINHILKEKNLDKNIFYLFKGYTQDFLIKYRYKYEKNIKKFFEAKKKKNEKSEIYLMSEDMYKKSGAKENNKVIQEQEKYIIQNYRNIFLSCRHLIEGFFGIKENIYINFDLQSSDFNKNQKDNLLYCFIQFQNFTDFFIKCEKKSEQLFLWKNLLLSFRLLLKLNILHDNFFLNFNFLLYHLYNIIQTKDIFLMINNDQFKIIFSGILFLLCIFFEYEEIEGYEIYILYMFLPLFIFTYYFRKIYLDNSLSFIKDNISSNNNSNVKPFAAYMNINDFYFFIQNENEKDSTLIYLLKKLMIVNYLLKNKEEIEENMFEFDIMIKNLGIEKIKGKNICQILDDLYEIIINDKNLNDDINDNQMKDIDEIPKKNLYNLFFNFNTNKNKIKIYNHKKIFEFLISEFSNDINRGLCPKSINPNLLSFCSEFDYDFIISFPKYAVEYLNNIYKIPCEYCKRKGKAALICLDCEKKIICKGDEYNKTNKNNKLDIESFCKHVDICGGGSGAFLNIRDFSIMFIQQKKLSKIKIPIYLDKHGESIKENFIHNDFRLNEAQVNKAIRQYYNNDIVFH